MRDTEQAKRERAARVRRFREAVGLTIAELGALCGVTRSVAWRWENADIPKPQKPQLHHLGRLEARYPGVTNYVFYGDCRQLPLWLAERIMQGGPQPGDGA